MCAGSGMLDVNINFKVEEDVEEPVVADQEEEASTYAPTSPSGSADCKRFEHTFETLCQNVSPVCACRKQNQLVHLFDGKKLLKHLYSCTEQHVSMPMFKDLVDLKESRYLDISMSMDEGRSMMLLHST